MVPARRRADVSWITTEDLDRDKEVVLSKGMDDSHFKLNAIVTLQHCYYMPPVGKSVWRKKARDDNMRGIKPKTQNPKKSDGWPQDTDWPPDVSFTLVQSGRVNRRRLTDRGARRQAGQRAASDRCSAGKDRSPKRRR